MHISSLVLYTYTPNELINGVLEIAHEGAKVTVNLSEQDRENIQTICVNAFLAERQKIADELLANSPAFVALEAPDNNAEDAEFESVGGTDAD